MPKRKHQRYNRPRKLYDAALIKEENDLIKKYGLKNRREVWRANYSIGSIRSIAKKLITASEDKKSEFVERQKKRGFAVESFADILALNKEDYLKRRLQSILVKNGMAKTYRLARQLIAHKHVLVKGGVIDAPSHLTKLDEEGAITLNIQLPGKKELSKEEEDMLSQIRKSGAKAAEESEDENEAGEESGEGEKAPEIKEANE